MGDQFACACLNQSALWVWHPAESGDWSQATCPSPWSQHVDLSLSRPSLHHPDAGGQLGSVLRYQLTPLVDHDSCSWAWEERSLDDSSGSKGEKKHLEIGYWCLPAYSCTIPFSSFFFLKDEEQYTFPHLSFSLLTIGAAQNNKYVHHVPVSTPRCMNCWCLWKVILFLLGVPVHCLIQSKKWHLQKKDLAQFLDPSSGCKSTSTHIPKRCWALEFIPIEDFANVEDHLLNKKKEK